jgi:hypothetical protein
MDIVSPIFNEIRHTMESIEITFQEFEVEWIPSLI